MKFYQTIYDKLYSEGYHQKSQNASWMLGDILPWLGTMEGWETFLDVGSSSGGAVQRVMDMGRVAVGVDVAKQAVATGVSLGRDIRLASATDLPFPAKHFDVVATSDTLEHLRPEDVQIAIEEMVRVCRKYLCIRICPHVDVGRWKNVVGHNLHLTVKSVSWWIHQFRPYGTVLWKSPTTFCVARGAADV